MVFIIFSEDGNAQRRRGRPSTRKFKSHNFVNNISVIGGLGVSSYYGDICSGFDCVVLRPSASIGGQYRINGNFSVRSQLVYAKMAGKDAGGKNYKRNLSFRTNLYELNAVMIYDIFEFYRMYLKRHKFNPYVFVGAALYAYNPQARLDKKWYNLRPLRTEGNKYSKINFAIPFGGGCRYTLSPFTSIGLEAGYRWTFTDYLDDVSTQYVSKSQLSDIGQQLADRSIDGFMPKPGAKRGNPKRDDGYFVFQATIEHTIQVTRQSYNIKRNKSRFRMNKSRVRYK